MNEMRCVISNGVMDIIVEPIMHRSLFGEALSAFLEGLVLLIGLLSEHLNLVLHLLGALEQLLIGACELLDGGFLVLPEEAK